ncbi:MAG: family 43 glycosylhydrolase [Bacteroidia bacterium]|nr:family 43 glycosylhydrolase [Bacteroidia bacterium]
MNEKLFIPFFLILLSGFGCSNKSVLPLSDLFNHNEEPVFQSPFNIAADPSILVVGDTTFMYYSAENQKIGLVISVDSGKTWQSPDGNSNDDFGVLNGRDDAWDQVLETVDVIRVGDEFWMYYTGYRPKDKDNKHVNNYEIGLATSNDGFKFTRHPQSLEKAILQRDTTDENTNDRHALTSPGVILDNGKFYMIYAGWNVADNWRGANAGIRILGATSDDGIKWTKMDQVLLGPNDVPYTPDVNEASLIKSEDGYWYIPFSTDKSIGIARSKSFESGYEVYPETIVPFGKGWKGEVTAPDGFIEDGKLKLWYHGAKRPLYLLWSIGFSEADYPLDWN